MPTIRLFLLALSLLTLAACQPKNRGAVTDPTNKNKMTAEIPVPSAWAIVSYTANGQKSQAVNDRGFVAIREQQIGGNTGCNSFGGDFTGSPAKMKVGGVAATKMFCAEANEQEQTVLQLLRGNVTASMDGDLLVLSGNKHSLTLRRDDDRLQ